MLSVSNGAEKTSELDDSVGRKKDLLGIKHPRPSLGVVVVEAGQRRVSHIPWCWIIGSCKLSTVVKESVNPQELVTYFKYRAKHPALFLLFETGSYTVAQTSLELLIFLPPFP